MKPDLLYKYTLLTLITIFYSVVTVSCVDDTTLFVSDETDNGPVLILSTASPNSRGDEHYEDDPFGEASTKNEEAIHSAELYFFKSETDVDAAFYHIKVSDIDKITRAELRLKLPMSQLDNFQPKSDAEDKTAYVYALVNLPTETALPDDASATLDALKNVKVENPGFASATQPSDFVMRGGNEVTLTGSDRDAVIKGWIPLVRLAAKVRMFCNIHSDVYLDENGKSITREENETDAEWGARWVEHWVPCPTTTGTNGGKDNAFLYFYNFTTNALINGSTGTTADDTFTRYDWLEYDNIDRRTERIGFARAMKTGLNVADYTYSNISDEIPQINKDEYPYTHEYAYYSYPNRWNSSNIEEDHATNVTLRLQWQCVEDKNNEGSQRFEYFYYQIPVNRLAKSGNDADRMDPNTYYRIKIDIAMLGAKDLGTPLEINATWEALPWRTEGVDVNIKGRRYLVVNQTDWVMNNVSTIQIPFSSSHEVEIVHCYVNYFRYNEVWGRDNESYYYDYTTRRWGNKEHDSTEFNDWLKEAEKKGLLKRGGEGELKLTRDEDDGFERILYYKDKYFYDSVYNELKRKDDLFDGPAGYKYYVGHEKPYTYQNQENGKYLVRPSFSIPAECEEGWNKFEQIYGQGKKIYECEVDNKNHLITFTHPLVIWKDMIVDKKFFYYPELKNGKLRDQFSRMEIIIKIKHKDQDEGSLFEETVYITQYPGIYIEVSHDYGNPYYDGNQNRNSSNNEYVLVNGHSSSRNSNYPWAAVNVDQMYSFAGNNCNPNMYVIHTTQLSEDNPNYIIGDPRNIYYNNRLSGASNDENSQLFLSYNQPLVHTSDVDWLTDRYGQLIHNYSGVNGVYVVVPDMYFEYIGEFTNILSNTTEFLKRYYPTDETGFYLGSEEDLDKPGTKIDYIAPSFRIASSFGKVTQNNLETARRRCAVYQEAGRPAGRWRLPTKAEVEFIASLSADKKIPVLFGDSKNLEYYGRYWTAQGKIEVNAYGDIKFPTSDHGDGEYSPRCLYDEWYWNQIDSEKGYKLKETETNFYWGDLPKDNTQIK